MADTYISVNSYDIGCDECGWYDTVLDEWQAESETRNHVCPVEEAPDGDEDTTSG